MNNHTRLLHEILLAYGSRPGVRLFKQNTGAAWMGDEQRLPDGSILIRNARRVPFGLCPGSSDIIGWESVEITADMVGQRLAAFVAIEGKTGRGRASEKQQNFLAAVQVAGGRAGIARSPDDAGIILKSE